MNGDSIYNIGRSTDTTIVHAHPYDAENRKKKKIKTSMLVGYGDLVLQRRNSDCGRPRQEEPCIVTVEKG